MLGKVKTNYELRITNYELITFILPAEWVQTVEDALKIDQYTVSNRSLRESTDGLYQALKSNVQKLKEQIGVVEAIG